MRILALLLLTATASLAQDAPVIYKWVDVEGNTHFSDCPPAPVENCEIEEIVVDPGPEISEEERLRIQQDRAEALRELQERAERTSERRRTKRQVHREEQALKAEFRTRQCTLARQNLEAIFRAEPVYRVESRTSAVRQREDETQKDIETMHELIEQYCDD